MKKIIAALLCLMFMPGGLSAQTLIPPFSSAGEIHTTDDPLSFGLGFGLSTYDPYGDIDAPNGIIKHNACTGSVGLAGHGARIDDSILLPITVSQDGWYRLRSTGQYKGQIFCLGHSVFGVTSIQAQLKLRSLVYDSYGTMLDVSEEAILVLNPDPLIGALIDIIGSGAYDSLMIYFNSLVAAGSVPAKVVELVKFVDQMKSIMALEQLAPRWENTAYPAFDSFTLSPMAYLESGKNYYLRIWVDTNHIVYAGGASGAWANTDLELNLQSVVLTRIGSAPDQGSIHASMSGVQANDVNAVILYDADYMEIARQTDPQSLPCTFSDVIRGKEYRLEAYCWDMLAGEYGPVTFDSVSSTYSIPSVSRRPLTFHVQYSNGSPIPGASVRLYSWDGHLLQENYRTAATTGADGNATIMAWPTRYAHLGERYIARAYVGGQKVWENVNVTLANTPSGSTYNAIANFMPSNILHASSGSNGSISPSGDVTVAHGSSQGFTASPSGGYEVDRWYLDGSAVQTGGNSYTVSNVQASHSVFVTFKPVGGGGAITVISPQSGATWFSGRSDYITWEWEGEIGENVKIDLFKGGSIDSTIIAETANDGTYRWTIPHGQTEGSDYRVRVSTTDGSISEYSDYFTIEPWSDVSVVEIYNVSQLQQVATGGAYPRDAYYKLMNDIDVGGINWTPIGADSAHYFRGTFDGQGHRIIDLRIDRPNDRFVGLFSVIMDSATVKNLYLECDLIHGYGYANIGGLADGGVGTLAAINAGTIINCHADVVDGAGGEVDLESTFGSRLGGLVGQNYRGVIRNCSAINIEIESEGENGSKMGGLVGENLQGEISWCWTNCRIDGDNAGADGDQIGGIAGLNSGLVKESFSICTLVDGTYKVGGIVGENESGGNVENCYWSGSGLSVEAIAGGIAGENHGTVIKCYVTGGVSANNDVGRLVGKDGTVSDSFYTGSPAVGSGGTVTNCHSKSDAELKQQATFTTAHSANWDFTDIWAIQEGVDYPQLRGVGSVLSAPAGVTASNDQSDGVHISWNAVTYDLAGGTHSAAYRVYRSDSTDAGAPKVELGSWQVGLTFIDDTAAPEATYYYWVKTAATTGGARESKFSVSASGMRTIPPADTPMGITASDGAPHFILIEWSGVANANFYRVYRSNTAGGTKTALGSWQTGLSLTDTPPNPETDYYFWVVAAVDDAGGRSSGYSGPDTGSYVIPDETAPTISISIIPEAPIETQAVTISIVASDNKTLDRIELHWDDGTTHTQTWDNINTASSSPSHGIGAFAAGTEVEYWAEVWDVAGNRTESERRAVTIRQEAISVPDRPDGLTELQPVTVANYESGGASSSLGSSVEYQFDWGDGSTSEWGATVRDKSWETDGQYFVKVRARSQTNPDRVSQWSSSILVVVETPETGVEADNWMLY